MAGKVDIIVVIFVDAKSHHFVQFAVFRLEEAFR